jgi:hypothetical protein
MIRYFKIVLEEKEYSIKIITYGDPRFFSTTSYSFEVEISKGKFEPLKTQCDNELVRDLCCIMGLDPEKELTNIAIAEIKNELMEKFKCH